MDHKPSPKAELKQAFANLVDVIPPKDLATIMFPPALGLEMLQGSLAGKDLSIGDFDPDMPEVDLLEAILGFVRWLSIYYFHTMLEGLENVPEGPVLFVGNHNAGLLSLDTLIVIDQIRQYRGRDRIIQPLVHDAAYMSKTTAHHAKRMGALRASRENADLALSAGRDVIAYPGGDREAFRRFQDRNKVILAGRKGFVRTALKNKVPIVPVVSAGLHESFVVLSTGKRIAAKLGLKNIFHSDLAAFGLSFPWGLAPSFFPFIPLPTPIDIRILAPFEMVGEPDDQAAVDRGYEVISSVMQKTMDELTADRLPWLGRPRPESIVPPPPAKD